MALGLEVLVSNSNGGEVTIAMEAVVLTHTWQILIDGQMLSLSFWLMEIIIDGIVSLHKELGSTMGLVGVPPLLHASMWALPSHLPPSFVLILYSFFRLEFRRLGCKPAQTLKVTVYACGTVQYKKVLMNLIKLSLWRKQLAK